MPEINLNQIDEMIDHLRMLKKEGGTEKAVSAARAIGFFFDTLRDEMKPESSLYQDDKSLFFSES